MKITTVVLNHNGLNDTLECLSSLKTIAHSQFDFEVVVVDNASTDASVATLKKAFSDVTLIVNSKNLGYAEGNNVGVHYALSHAADYIFLLNNDTKLAPNSIENLLVTAENHKQGGIFGPKIYFYPGFETHKSRYLKKDLGRILWYAGGRIDWENVFASHRGVDELDSGQYEEIVKTSYVSGCAMFVKKKVFETVGLFDKKFYLYYEDVDFCQRARNKHFDVYYVPTANIWHKNAHSSGGTGSDLQDYYITRNRLLIGMRFAPWKTKLALLREATMLLMRGSKAQRQAVGDFIRKKYGLR